MQDELPVLLASMCETILALCKKMGVQPGRCRNCDCYPEPDGIAHKCSYWERMTNSEGYCSNWRLKS